MTVFVVGADSVHAGAALCDYLADRVDEGDAVHAVNSLRGGDATSSDDVRDGEDALNAVASRLGVGATVETHQFVRGNAPATDLLEVADEHGADELVVGVQKRNPAGKAVFGSTAGEVLLNSTRPVVAVPLPTA